MEEMSSATPDLNEQRDSTGFRNGLARRWLREMHQIDLQFAWPMISVATGNKLYWLCKYFKQDANVFATAVHVLDSYLERLAERQLSPRSPLLVLISVLYMCGKLSGNPWDYRVRHVASIYRRLLRVPRRRHDRRQIVATEMNVLSVLNFRLPLVTEMDDLATLLYLCIRPMHAYPSVCETARSLMVVYLVHRKRIYHRLMRAYLMARKPREDFGAIITNRFFAPLAAIIGAFRELHAADGRAWRAMRAIGADGNVAWNVALRLAGLLRKTWKSKLRCRHHRLQCVRCQQRLMR